MRDLQLLGRLDCTLLWDLDGTIADTRRDIAAGVTGLLASRGLPPLPLDRVIHHVGRGVRVLVSACLAEAEGRAAGAEGGPSPPAAAGGERSTAPGTTPSAATAARPSAAPGDNRGWSLPIESVANPTEAQIDEAVEVFREHYRRHLMDTTVAYGNLPETLRELHRRGRRMAVVSNKPEDLSREIVDRLGLLECFVVVLGGDSLRKRKPDPEPMRHALRLCHAAAGSAETARSWSSLTGAEAVVTGTPAAGLPNTVFEESDTRVPAAVIGDSIIDAQAARAAGLLMAGVSWGFDPDGAMRQTELDWWFESPEELGRALLPT